MNYHDSRRFEGTMKGRVGKYKDKKMEYGIIVNGIMVIQIILIEFIVILVNFSERYYQMMILENIV